MWEGSPCLIRLAGWSLRARRSTWCSAAVTLKQHPEVVVAVMQTAASDWAASRLAVAIERVAAALVEPVEEPPIMPARELLRVQP